MQIFTHGGFARGSSRNLAGFKFRAASAGKSGYSMEFETPFPSDYDELLKQVSIDVIY